jgi:hypothetical protein
VLKLSAPRKQGERHRVEALVLFAWSSSDLFEDLAEDVEDVDFDNIALSIRLLICTLHFILSDSLPAIYGPLRLWVPWAMSLLSRASELGSVYFESPGGFGPVYPYYNHQKVALYSWTSIK